ncbi:MAG TPA: ROK family protein, partial [Actinomycetota bacterium]|nr:ROK family protein [Actinomycetota bacterium]
MSAWTSAGPRSPAAWSPGTVGCWTGPRSRPRPTTRRPPRRPCWRSPTSCWPATPGWRRSGSARPAWSSGRAARPAGPPHNTYRRMELRRLLHERTGLPTMVDNDANVAAWAEARFGGGAVTDDLVLVTVGTGIGGGLVLDGRLYHGEHGFAGELGHLIVDPDGDRCACGNRGCLEAMASGSTLGRLGREAAAADPGGRLATLAAATGGPVT